MPTYQYSCTVCGEPLEIVQAFTDDTLTECPSCGGRLRKLYNAVGIVFKGSGFYRTDSRSGSSSTVPATPGSSSGDAGSSSGAAPAATPTPSTGSGSTGSGSTGSGSSGSGSSGSGSSGSGSSGSGSSGSGSSGSAA